MVSEHTTSIYRWISEHTTSLSSNFGIFVAWVFSLCLRGVSLVCAKVGVKVVEDQRIYCFSPTVYIPYVYIYMFYSVFSFLVSLAFRPFSVYLSKAYTLPAVCQMPEFTRTRLDLLTTSLPSGTMLNLALPTSLPSEHIGAI